MFEFVIIDIEMRNVWQTYLLYQYQVIYVGRRMYMKKVVDHVHLIHTSNINICIDSMLLLQQYLMV